MSPARATTLVVATLAATAPLGAQTPIRPATDLTIGASDGDDALVFQRVVSAATDARGRILVLDQLAGEVRIFGPDGRFVARAGRPGRGPGDLSPLANTVLAGPGDSVLVPDPLNARISVFEPGGRFVRSIPLPPRPQGHGWIRTPAGFVFRGTAVSRGPRGFELWDGLLRVGLEGAAAPAGPDTLIRFEYPRTDIGGPGAPRVPMIVNSAFFARWPDGRVVWGSLDRDDLSIHGPDGRPAGTLTHPGWVRRPLTDRDRAAMRSLLRTKLRWLRGDTTAADGAVDFPERLPAITGLRVGPGGLLWVQRMGSPADADPMAINAWDRSEWLGGRIWERHRADGTLVDTIELEPGDRLAEIGADHLLVIRRAADGSERVARLRLPR